MLTNLISVAPSWVGYELLESIIHVGPVVLAVILGV